MLVVSIPYFTFFKAGRAELVFATNNDNRESWGYSLRKDEYKGPFTTLFPSVSPHYPSVRSTKDLLSCYVALAGFRLEILLTRPLSSCTFEYVSPPPALEDPSLPMGMGSQHSQLQQEKTMPANTIPAASSFPPESRERPAFLPELDERHATGHS